MVWVERGHITDLDEYGYVGKKQVFSLKSGHKYSIVKVISKSQNVPEITKQEMLDKVLGEDKSDISIQCRMQCEASRNHMGCKRTVWYELIDPKTKLSLKERQAKMNGFYSWDQIDTCTPFFDKFYDCLKDLYKAHTFKYIEIFFYALLPRMVIEDRHIVKLMTIKGEIPDTNSMFSNMLQDGIELLVRGKKIRAFAVTDQESKM